MGKKTKKVKLYTEETIAEAVAKVLGGAEVYPTAKCYPGMSRSMLRNRVREAQGLFARKKQGRKNVLPVEVEEKLAGYVRQMARLGLGPTVVELGLIVKDYIEANELITRFENNVPGQFWIASFMQRYNLALKKGGQMQVARKNVTSDPFVIFGFYDMLEEELQRLGIENRPECIYNADESGFPTDPSKCRTIGAVGEKTFSITCGANRENTTVLACCSADGHALDPLIIFRGKNLQSSWRGDQALPDTTYAVSENGWITTEIFHEWFKGFCERTVGTRPLLLIVDGHITHTSLETIALAQSENVSIMKLPAHTTDVIQALDVACFAPLKAYYEKELTQHVQQTGAREPLRRAGFVNMLSKIWRLGLSERNVKAGFAATGVFPANREKYNISRLSTVKMQSYKRWKEAGCPVDTQGDPVIPPADSQAQPPADSQAQQLSIDTEDESLYTDEDLELLLASQLPSTSSGIQSAASRATPPSQHQKDDAASLSTLAPSSQTPTSRVTSSRASSVSGSQTPGFVRDEPLALTRALQRHAPPGMRYSILLVPAEDETSFEAVIKSRGRPSSTVTVPAKRHRVSMHGAIITDEEYARQIMEKAAAKKPAARKLDDTARPKPQISKQRKKRARKRVTSESETESESPSDNSGQSDSSDSELDISSPAKLGISVKNSTARKHYTI